MTFIKYSKYRLQFMKYEENYYRYYLLQHPKSYSCMHNDLQLGQEDSVKMVLANVGAVSMTLTSYRSFDEWR